MPSSIRPGDVLGERYLLEDLLSESGGGRFWRAHDRTLERHVAVHVVSAEDEHAEAMMSAARSSATVADRRILRVLDVDRRDHLVWVVNEWGSGISLDRLVGHEGPVGARRAAWMVSEVADTLTAAHAEGIAHGRLVPENVLVDRAGQIRVIGFSVEAALLGLPPGRVSSDVVDLASLLYHLLTGRWPGVSRSAVPDAPQEAGRVLRPRQVKAGIPRLLDTLCDQVINPWAEHPPTPELLTAEGIRDVLRDFVGDPTGMAQAEAGRHDTGETMAISLPPLPDPPARREPDPTVALPVPKPGPTPTPEPEPEPEPEAPTPPAPAREDLPTQAGMPIFDDDNDDVSWLEARRDPPPPPPPFEEPPERPLFSASTHKPRPNAAPAAAAKEYWPWDTHAGATGSGVIPATRDDDEEDDEVPGRSWLRLAFAVGLCALLLVAVVFAFNLGRGRSPLGGEPEAERSPSASASSRAPAAEPIAGVAARDFDPQAEPPSESPETVGQAVDGDPATTWRTSTYTDQLGRELPALKSGVGLVLDLGEPYAVSGVDLTLVGEPTDVSIFVTDTDPENLSGLTPVTRGTAGTEQSFDLESPTTGQYVVVWLTALPAVEGGFRAEVAEAVVRGAASE